MESPVKAVSYILSVVLLLFAMLMIVAGVTKGPMVTRVSVGVIALVVAGLLVWLARARPVQHTHVHKMEVDVSGDVELEQMKCQQCTATLSSESVKVSAGAIIVHCQYCGAKYQIEEDAKW